jgi:hypothetical protein
MWKEIAFFKGQRKPCIRLLNACQKLCHEFDIMKLNVEVVLKEVKWFEFRIFVGLKNLVQIQNPSTNGGPVFFDYSAPVF